MQYLVAGLNLKTETYLSALNVSMLSINVKNCFSMSILF